MRFAQILFLVSTVVFVFAYSCYGAYYTILRGGFSIILSQSSVAYFKNRMATFGLHCPKIQNMV